VVSVIGNAVRAAFAADHDARRHATSRKRGPDLLLAGLLVTAECVTAAWNEQERLFAERDDHS
jgi:hypothetical protein